MFFLIPIGVEGAHVRLPVVSIGILLLCLWGFTVAYLLPEKPMGVDGKDLEQVFEYLEEHPRVKLSDDFADRFLNAQGKTHLEKMRKAQEQLSGDWPPQLNQDQAQEEQRAFDALVAAVVAKADQAPMRHYGLVSNRGFFQVGWLTHMFLHFGWMHLLGNMLFLYIVGPLLEDAWGRWRFGAFYVVGGLVAALAHYLLTRGDSSVMAGASGAVAACMGAFGVRFAKRKIALLYFIYIVRIFTGRWELRAWICGLTWFLLEVWSLYRGHTAGVAVMAHVGGFAFGSLVALSMRAAGMDKKLVAISETAPLIPDRDSRLDKAQTAVMHGQLDDAKAGFEAVLKDDPHHVLAQAGLIRIGLLSPDRAAAVKQLEQLLTQLVKGKETFFLPEAILFCWPSMTPADIKPALAFQLGRTLEDIQAFDVAETMYERAGDEPGLMGLKALFRALELRLRTPAPEVQARLYVRKLEARADLTPEWRQKLNSLVASLTPAPAELPSAAAEPLEEAPRRRSARPPQVMRVRVESMEDTGLRVTSHSGQTQALPWHKIVGVAAGRVGEGGAEELMVDLVIHWGDEDKPLAIVRLGSANSGLETLFPALSGQRLFSQFASEALLRSGGTGLPDSGGVHRGDMPSYPNLDAWMSTHYP